MVAISENTNWRIPEVHSRDEHVSLQTVHHGCSYAFRNSIYFYPSYPCSRRRFVIIKEFQSCYLLISFRQGGLLYFFSSSSWCLWWFPTISISWYYLKWAIPWFLSRVDCNCHVDWNLGFKTYLLLFSFSPSSSSSFLSVLSELIL